MFNGEEQQMVIQFDNALAGVVIDRFGKEVSIMHSDREHFTVCLRIALSPVFIRWLFQFGVMARVLSQESLTQTLSKQAKALAQFYEQTT